MPTKQYYISGFLKATLFFLFSFSNATFSYTQFGELVPVTEFEFQAKHTFFEDLNGDGYKDLAIQPKHGALFVWYKNDGNGNFRQVDNIGTISKKSSSILLKDYDDDEDIDLFIIDLDRDKKCISIDYYKNDGDGYFVDSIRVFDSPNGEAGKLIHIEDFDEDGYLDFLFQVDFRIFLHKGNVSYLEEKERFKLTFSADIKKTFTTDANEDGEKDLIFVSNDAIYHFQNDGEGYFSKTLKMTFDYKFEPSSVSFLDFNDDGYKDLLHFSSTDKYWYENNGFGEYTEKEIFFEETGWFHRSIKAVGDFNKDGKPDIIKPLTEVGLTWSRNKKKGQLSKPILIDDFVNSSLSFVKLIFVEDINGDDNLDIIVELGNKLFWYKNNGKGKFSERKLLMEWGEIRSNELFFDVNGDGRNDMVNTSNKNPQIYWQENVGDYLETPVPLIGLKSPYKFEKTDLDGDGDDDLVAAFLTIPSINEFQREYLNGYLNNGSGDFSEYFPIFGLHDEIGKFLNTSIGDVDKNGYPDLVYIRKRKNTFYGYDDVSIYFLPNDGKGNFLEEREILKFDYLSVEKWFIQDLDQDGDNDILYLPKAKDYLGFIENEGQESYVLNKKITLSNIYNVELVDVNGDDYLDIIASSKNGGIIYLENNQKSDFLEEKLIIDFSNLSFFRCLDLDKDKDLDILTAAVYRGETPKLILRIYTNDNNANFILKDTKELEILGSIIEVLDIDLDGNIEYLIKYNGHLHKVTYTWTE